MNRNIALSLIFIFFASTVLHATIVEVEKEPVVIKKVEPKYPEKAFRERIKGQVIVAVLVSIDGKPKDARVVKTSNEIFNDAAMEAARQWLFSPAILNKKPVPFWLHVPFDFNLEKSDSLTPADTLLEITEAASIKLSDNTARRLQAKEKEDVIINLEDGRSGFLGNPVAIRKDAVMSVSPTDYVPAYGEPQQVDERAALLHRVEPNYPPIAYANRIEGRVVLALLLGTDGKVLDLKVMRSSNEIFNEDATACAKRWVFRPAILKGNPIKFWYTDSLDFRIK